MIINNTFFLNVLIIGLNLIKVLWKALIQPLIKLIRINIKLIKLTYRITVVKKLWISKHTALDQNYHINSNEPRMFTIIYIGELQEMCVVRN